jgi:hypothetical protein
VHCLVGYRRNKDLSDLLEIARLLRRAGRHRLFQITVSRDTDDALTQELVESVLPKTASGQPIHPDLKAWNKIVHTFNDLKQIRNRIAHHPVSPRATTIVGGLGVGPRGSVPTGGFGSDYWYENYVSTEERLRGRHDQTRPLGVGYLKAHYRVMFGLTKVLDEFLENRPPAYL